MLSVTGFGKTLAVVMHLSQSIMELFNSTRPREYDGSHIRFGGMNPDITLREHQRNAIAHVLYGGNTLLAHESVQERHLKWQLRLWKANDWG